jgi:hypothetical protein
MEKRRRKFEPCSIRTRNRLRHHGKSIACNNGGAGIQHAEDFTRFPSAALKMPEPSWAHSFTPAQGMPVLKY